MRDNGYASVKWIVLVLVFIEIAFSGYVFIQDGADAQVSVSGLMLSHAPLIIFEVAVLSMLVLFEIKKSIVALIIYSMAIAFRLASFIVLAANGFLTSVYVAYALLWGAFFILLLVKGRVFARIKARFS